MVSEDPKAAWWSTSSLVGDATGSFREFAESPDGRLVRLRAPDGIHFTEEGASTMTGALMKWLDPSSESARGVRELPPARPAAPLNETEPLPWRETIAVAQPGPTRHSAYQAVQIALASPRSIATPGITCSSHRFDYSMHGRSQPGIAHSS